MRTRPKLRATLLASIAALLFREADAGKQEEQSREVFSALQQGKINRALFTDNCNSYFTEQALKDFASSLGPLGTPTEFTQTSKRDRGGMTFRLFEVRFPQKTVEVWERIMPDGKIEQYQVAARSRSSPSWSGWNIPRVRWLAWAQSSSTATILSAPRRRHLSGKAR